MKVIRELIDYFTQSSVLSEEDLRQLRASGWSLESDGDLHLNSDGSVVRPKSNPESEDEAWTDEPDLTPPLPPKRETSGPKPRLPIAKGEVLEAWLAERLPAWREATEAIDALSPAGRRHLRDLDPVDAAGLLRSALEDREVTWAALWSALLLDDYRLWFAEPNARGPATQAYRVHLGASPLSEVTKYRWLLRFPHIAETCVLAGAQRALLRGISHALQDEPAWIAEWISREKCPAGLLTLVLAEGARCFDPIHPAMPKGELPSRALPDATARLQALHAAALMNPSQAVPFLCFCARRWDPLGLADAADYAGLDLRTPATWHVGAVIPGYAMPSIPCRVRIDAKMTEDDEERFFAQAEEVRAVTSQFGICEMRVLPNRNVTSYCNYEFYLQIIKFTDATSRRGFSSEALQTMLAERVHLETRTGEAPCFHASVTHVRKEIVI